MSGTVLTPRELEPQLRHILEHYKEDVSQRPRPVAFFSECLWDGPRTLNTLGLTFEVKTARSVLELREALICTDRERLPVILTVLQDQALPQDIRARLLRFRLFRLDIWEAVKALFQATSVDPRLRDRAVADALLTHAPPDGYPPVPAGVLDADSAWRALYRAGLELGSRVPEGRDLIRWGGSVNATMRYTQAEPGFRLAVREHFVERLGSTARLVFAALEAGAGQELYGLGLLCDLLEQAWEVAPHEAELVAARAEYLVGKMPLGREDVKGMAADMRALLEDSTGPGPEIARLNDFDSLLLNLRAEALAHQSRFSPMGFDTRLERLGQALSGESTPIGVAWERLESVRSHWLAEGQGLLMERCAMLVRLAAWLRSVPSLSEGTLQTLGRDYIQGLVWVDRAREQLAPADLGPQLSRAAKQLLSRVNAWRAEFNEVFARQLVTTHELESWSAETVAIERVLERLVVPEASRAPVLLIVLDGMSWAVAVTLAEGLAGMRWELMGAEEARPPLVLATLPTVTAFSRSSLLCGELCAGSASKEKAGFGAHAGLVSVSRPSKPPLLFHKDSLSEDGRGGLSRQVGQAVADNTQRVVAVVVNAVDDRLSGAIQVDTRWQLDAITPLRSLLEAAAEAGRRVILTSDHGHVWEDTSRKVVGGQSARWREATGPAGPGELAVAGRRIEVLTGHTSIIAPWAEQVRYGMPKAGYHGGLTPQEVLVPFLIAMPPDRRAAGLTPLELRAPAWWSREGAEAGVPREGARDGRPKTGGPETSRSGSSTRKQGEGGRKKRDTATLSMFPVPTPAGKTDGPVEKKDGSEGKKDGPVAHMGATSRLLERLLVSETWQGQVRLAGRHMPATDVVEALLTPLIEAGGRQPVAALSTALGLPAHRVHGLVSQMTRVLNVDGYPVLTLERAEGAVRLELSLLKAQFELGEEG